MLSSNISLTLGYLNLLALNNPDQSNCYWHQDNIAGKFQNILSHM